MIGRREVGHPDTTGGQRIPALLVVDDDPAVLTEIQRMLAAAGFERTIATQDPAQIPDLIARDDVVLVLLDLVIPGHDGERVLAKLHAARPDLPVIVFSAHGDVAAAVRCIKLGAADFLLKPFDGEELRVIIGRTMDQCAVQREAERLRESFFADRLRDAEPFADIVTADPVMLRLFVYLEAIGRSTSAVLVEGETGTGKELVARALHRCRDATAPFVAVHAAGVDDAVFSDTLFGHVKGAYTGALEDRQGMIERAGHGTLFLDEIGDLSEASQIKLLRLLQEREFYPLGTDESHRLNARVIAATNRDPRRLRPDLYYRLRSYHVRLPPLRERAGDIPLLVTRFLQAAAADLGRKSPSAPAELAGYLANYEFPGNVRELRSVVFDAVARHDRGVMPLRLFLEGLESVTGAKGDRPGVEFAKGRMPTLRETEDAAVREALRRTEGNQTAAAKLLGVSRPTVARFVRRAK